MRSFILFLGIFLFFSQAESQERVSVKQQSKEEIIVSELIDKIKSAIDNEDYAAYSNCLTKELLSKNKKKSMLLFLEKDLGLDVEKFLIIDSNEDEIEFIIKYSIHSEQNTEHITANSFIKRINGEFLLYKENIISRKQIQPENEIELNNKCLDGNCPLPIPNFEPQQKRLDPGIDFDQRGRQILRGISATNDENGNPDPNGIMWIDPKVLLRKFPEKYGVPKCLDDKCRIR